MAVFDPYAQKFNNVSRKNHEILFFPYTQQFLGRLEGWSE